MRFRTPELFLGAFLTVAVFSIGILFSSQYSAQTTQSNGTEKPRQPTENKSPPKGFWEGVATDPVAAFTLGLVFIGLFQVGLFWVQLNLIGKSLIDAKIAAEAAKDAANAAKQSAEAQIAVEGGRLLCQPHSCSFWNQVGTLVERWPLASDKPLNRTFEISFVLKNYGKTPATIKEVVAVLIKSPDQPPNVFITTPLLDLPSETVIGSGLCSSGLKVEFSQYLIQAEAAQVVNGQQNLWFYGRIVYDDVFGREGTQTFVYKAKVRGGFSNYWDKTTYRKKESSTALS
jgi:hypothetical protein